ncbi:MAG: oligosaccharyl transferase glycoprotein complex, beta subunit [Caeruleum heppii]|nr:MAG: oligosaccharyl transferase glycoprotein complex, beta subunit [Caeruleum heppii]
MRSFLSLVVLVCVVAVQAISTTGNRLLVVLEETEGKGRFSKFWGDLEARGYQLSFESPKNEKLALIKHGERAYDHLILMPPKSKGLGPALTPAILLNFMKLNGNMLLTLSADQPTPSSITSLLLELSISLPADRNALVTDHFNYDVRSSAETHDVLLLPRPEALRSDVMNFFGAEDGSSDQVLALPHSVGHTLGSDSPLVAPILRAPSTAYSYNPKDSSASLEEDTFATGSQISLVSAFQARNAARLVVLGSVDALADEWSDAKVQLPSGKKELKTANRAFARQVTEWAFMEVGVLRVDGIEHYLASTATTANQTGIAVSSTDLNPKIYRVKNEMTYNIALSLYSRTHWIPYTPPASDAIQLEISMLSPFHRLTLSPSSQPTLHSSSSSTSQNTKSKPTTSTLYTRTFPLPQQHGIFTLLTNYKRPFLTPVEEKRSVTVRHFAHDEWERSWRISGAWVGVIGVWGTVVGWVVFVGLWLFAEPVGRREKRGKKVL